MAQNRTISSIPGDSDMTPDYNHSYLLSLFAKRSCEEGDVVFHKSNSTLVCWDRNASRHLGLQVPTTANATSQTPIEYALPLYGYSMPLLLIVTIVVNTLIMIVMSRRHMRTSTNQLLMTMALSDMLTLLIPSPWLIYLFTFGNYSHPFESIYSCYLYFIMINTLPSLFHTSSIWLTLALATQRYIYVCHPHVARVWCTTQRVTRTVVAIYICALLHLLSRFFDRSFGMVEVILDGQLTPSCTVGMPQWVSQVVNINLYFGLYFGFRLLFVHLLPCISLVVLNILLFRTLREAEAKRERLLHRTCKQRRDNNRATDAQCTTMMLIAVVSVFLLVEIPLAVVTCLHIIQNLMDDVQLLDYSIIQALVVVINFIISVSYPINFAIYCGMSRQFRDTFSELFLSGWTRRSGASGCSTANNGRATRTETVL